MNHFGGTFLERDMKNINWKKFARGTGLAALGAVAAYVSSVVIPDLEAAGLATIAMVVSSLANLVKLMVTKVSDND